MLNEKQRENFKNLLLVRKKELLMQTTSSRILIEELLSENTYDDIDYAEVSSDSYNLNILKDKQIEEIKEIDIALQKINNKTYGVCEMCDENIGVKRLKAKPHARFCVHCRPIYEKTLL